MNPDRSIYTILLGTASFLTLATIDAEAQEAASAQTAQAAAPEQVPEQVLITGSLIRGTVAVGVPVTNLSPQDLRTTGATTISDLFRTVPQFDVIPGPVATQGANTERGIRVNLRHLDTGIAPKSLLMVDGVRYPPQGDGLCQIDPSIIPDAGIERIDLLLDGASATYGSDAIGGVVNIVLKRAFDGAVTEAGFKSGRGGGNQYMASQLWGRTWDGGDITLSYQWIDNSPSKGSFAPNRLTFNFAPFGLDNRTPLGSSIPGTISLGAPANTATSPNFYSPTQGNNCTNCFAIPAGAGVPFAAGTTGIGPGPRNSIQGASVSPTVAWNGTTFVALNGAGAGGFGVNGTANEFNPYIITDYSAATQYNGATITVDQRLTKNISFYGEGIYGMRRTEIYANATGNELTVQVPTWNPYYPAGPLANSGLPGCPVNGAQAATCVPTNLRVSYHFSVESPAITSAYALGQRYLAGLNIDLPHDWAGQVYYSMTKDTEYFQNRGTVNKAAVSAALGWTMPVTAASGTTPAVATWTKPASIPYLNLFCDPRTIPCNSPATEAYIGNYNVGANGNFWINEKGIKADGPLFDLPGGAVKAAVGATYTSYLYNVSSAVEATSNTTVQLQNDAEHRDVWSVFGQLNVPVIGDENAFLGVRKLEFEASWRHDQYSDVGGTSNPKVAFNWTVSDDLGLTIRGSWGTSFRAPSFGEISPSANVGWNAFGLSNAPGGAQFQNNNTISISCDPATGAPAPGSGAGKLFSAGFGCNSQPAGLSQNGSSGPVVVAGWRDFVNTDQRQLNPELSTNYSATIELAPTMFLSGLDLQVTWYSIKINGSLTNFGAPTTDHFNTPSYGFTFITPEDLRDATGAQLCPGMNLTPQNCAPFEDMVRRALSQPTNTVPIAAASLIYWLNDGGSINAGWQKATGIDFSASYDWDLGEFGAWNAGITGTYYIEYKTQTVPGGPVTDVRYNVNLAPVAGMQQLGVESLPRFKYRARLGWSNGPWSVVGFMDYQSHFFHQQAAPPNVNNECLVPGGTVGGGSLPCAITNYSNIEPSYYTFDLSGAYDTGDTPANDYLKHVTIQLVVHNITDRHAPFEYRISTGGGGLPAAFDVLKDIYGRMFQVRIIKTW